MKITRQDIRQLIKEEMAAATATDATKAKKVATTLQVALNALDEAIHSLAGSKVKSDNDAMQELTDARKCIVDASKALRAIKVQGDK